MNCNRSIFVIETSEYCVQGMRVASEMDENMKGRFRENLFMLIIMLVICLMTILSSGLS
jgi:hypothetical protein